jgi:hypothetical protein
MAKTSINPASLTSSLLSEERSLPSNYRPFKQSSVVDEIRSKLIAPKQINVYGEAEAIRISRRNYNEMNLIIENYKELELLFGKEISEDLYKVNTSPELTTRLLSASRLLDALILYFSKEAYASRLNVVEEDYLVKMPLQ